ncbi:GNAT family N-acetyltransferase [Alkaliphilus peptidifermentans]|uniref:Acetyltransferase (GNAT) family protein n=1 Tax=Alkaliphilus peptidifermentans DSM 18978 TaxID=1120976 RepID=A0A1G5LHP2_9FIRM|nr:GNAT family N-acetyltransferase [Alkaliphilus peptidifermentans]SCZ11818.1 Acetyltransferase (GNAT) family protein [Alkaliphilus peptidifermentans DSM 18978]
MDTTDYIFDPDNPYICQGFIVYRKDFDKKINEYTLIENLFEIGLIRDYCILLNNAFSFQVPSDNLDDTIKYMHDLSRKRYFIDSFKSFWKENELVGFYWLNGNIVDKLVVKPDYQRLGYGTYLLTHAFKSIFLNNDYEYASLLCMLQNKKGLAFFRKYGLLDGIVE